MIFSSFEHPDNEESKIRLPVLIRASSVKKEKAFQDKRKSREGREMGDLVHLGNCK